MRFFVRREEGLGFASVRDEPYLKAIRDKDPFTECRHLEEELLTGFHRQGQCLIPTLTLEILVGAFEGFCECTAAERLQDQVSRSGKGSHETPILKEPWRPPKVSTRTWYVPALGRVTANCSAPESPPRS